VLGNGCVSWYCANYNNIVGHNVGYAMLDDLVLPLI
jgi:hypothetical protein